MFLLLNDEDRRALLEPYQMPDPMLDIIAGVGFRTTSAAYRLGVFTALAGGPLTAAQLADEIKASQRGVGILLDALEAFGYVRRQGDHYLNSEVTSRWLLPPGDREGYDFTVVYDFWGTNVFQLWESLEESVRRGSSAIHFYGWLQDHPDTSGNFQAMLASTARANAGEIAAGVELPATATRLLDVGGSHAMYSLGFLRQYPSLMATIFDFPVALAAGRQNIEAAGMSDRFTFQAGNFLTDGLGTGYDVVLLFKIVHGFLPDENSTLLHKAFDALQPGGHLVILENLAGELPAGDHSLIGMIHAMQKLNFFHLLGGQTYTLADVKGWLAAAGFVNPTSFALTSSPDSVIIAQKPA
jgi:hypothetical protein